MSIGNEMSIQHIGLKNGHTKYIGSENVHMCEKSP